jgi:hypothetical protein
MFRQRALLNWNLYSYVNCETSKCCRALHRMLLQSISVMCTFQTNAMQIALLHCIVLRSYSNAMTLFLNLKLPNFGNESGIYCLRDFLSQTSFLSLKLECLNIFNLSVCSPTQLWSNIKMSGLFSFEFLDLYYTQQNSMKLLLHPTQVHNY